jgi:hypothetical protein
LVVTGERAQEGMRQVAEFERDRTDNRDGMRVIRYVDH